MEPIVITGPITEPISVEEAMSQSRIDSTAEYGLLAIYIGAARAWYEWRCGMTIHEQTLEWTPDEWPLRDGYHYPPQENYYILPRATPLISVVSFKYKDSDGLETVWGASSYVADTDSRPGRLTPTYGESWPSFTPYPVSPIRIQYRAGIAIASPMVDTPKDIKYPILLLVGAMFENRESIVVANQAQVSQIAIQYGVEHFVAKHAVSHVF